ncbi:MAG TPA: translocation/assembly module TamB, partial [Microscillaceae bacterium]|nr:translocation/assembly module TamB [Microscillaceae bacterium]
DYFSNFLMALNGEFRNLQVIDKIPLPNESFYGKAFASGNLKVTGYIDNLVELKVNASSEKGTRLYMPLDGYTDVSQKSYIEFVNLKDTLKKEENTIKKVNLNGLKMDFNLDLNENAQFEIIFDKQAGDLIRATGNGKLNVEMDEEGDFSIFGDYVISKGTYNFTLLNLINKGFDINAGSKVSFIGDVYDSDIDIRAKYLRQVSLLPLLNLDQLENPQNPEYRRRYPVNVLLNLQGKLLNPEIKLDLDLGDANRIPDPVLSNAFRSVAATIQTDEQERNRQVFSVLVLQRFSPRNSFGGLGAATGSSLSELLSNQLSNWVSQVDKNLELTLDLDPSALDAAQLNVSYSLFDGRLRISREGGFTNTQNQTDVASVVGEWTLEYMLSPDGRFRAKMYNKNNQGLLNNVSLTNATTTTAGFSLLYTESFSSLGDLIKFGKKKKKRKKRNSKSTQSLPKNKKTKKQRKTDKATDPKTINH